MTSFITTASGGWLATKVDPSAHMNCVHWSHLGRGNGLLTVVYPEIPAVPQSTLKDSLRAADVEDESISGVALSDAFDRFIACHSLPQSLPAVFSVLPGVVTHQKRPHQEERIGNADSSPTASASHQSGDQRVPGMLIIPGRYPPHPSPLLEAREGCRLPRRTITAWPLERSTTVVGISPHSPESTTASGT